MKREPIDVGTPLNRLRDNIKDMQNLVYTSMKEFRNSMSAEDLNSAERRVKTAREDAFFRAFEDLNTTFSLLSNAINRMYDRILLLEEKVDKLYIPISPDTGSSQS